MSIDKILYAATATATGGREGRAQGSRPALPHRDGRKEGRDGRETGQFQQEEREAREGSADHGRNSTVILPSGQVVDKGRGLLRMKP